jgi:hypothetical protein
VDSRSQATPHREGQFITFTCPHGFVLNGSNAAVCTGNGRWEPDPGQVDCLGNYYNAHNGIIINGYNYFNTADCGLPLENRNVTLNYSSTLEGSRSVLVLTCESDIPVSIIKQIVIVTCHSSGN